MKALSDFYNATSRAMASNLLPDIHQLVALARSLAQRMSMSSPPDADLDNLLHHVLFAAKRGQLAGRDSWACYCNGLITARELRNLVCAHLATAIAAFNKLEEPDRDTYLSRDLAIEFDLALRGSVSQARTVDVLDPWERT